MPTVTVTVTDIAGHPTVANQSFTVGAMLDCVNVVDDYGAPNDGVAVADDEIQAAIDDAEAESNPPPLWFPNGEYLCNTGLVYDSNLIRIIGGGGQGRSEDPPGGATLIAGSDGMELLRINSSAGLIHEGPIIENMNFRDESASTDATLLRLHNINRWTLRNCTFRDAKATGGIGLHLTRESGGDNAWGKIDQCTFTACGTGIVGEGVLAATITGGHVTGSNTWSTTWDEDCQHVKGYGFKVDGAGHLFQGTHIKFDGCDAENADPGYRINDTGSGQRGKRNQIIGCGFSGSGTETCIDITSGSANNELIGNTYTHVAVKVADAGTNTLILDSAHKPEITGSRGGNAALADLLAELDTLGWITDSTTAS